MTTGDDADLKEGVPHRRPGELMHRREWSMFNAESEDEGRMNEIIFLVVDAPEGGYSARALGQSIFTEADTLDDLRRNVRDAVDCHFDDDKRPGIIRLHFVREEVLAP